MDYYAKIQMRKEALMRFFKERDLIGCMREKMRHMPSELILLFVLGVIIGFVLKDTIGRTITVGYDDYKIVGEEARYDINVLERNVNAEMENQDVAPAQTADPSQSQ